MKMIDSVITDCPEHGSYIANPDGCPRCGKLSEQPKTGVKRDLTTVQAMDSPKAQETRLIRFTIYGQPQPKQRPRLGKRKTYTPPKTKAYEADVKRFAGMAIEAPFVDNVFVYLSIYRQHRYRVDIDNITKAVLDGMNGIAYKDDFQVRKLFVDYTDGQDNPCVSVTITDVDNWQQALTIRSAA